ATALLERRQPTIYGDGEQTRDFTYVANVVDGVLRACDAPKAAGEVINVACGTRISLKELLRVMNPRRDDNGTGLQRGTRRRRERLPGRYLQGEGAAGVHADRRARGRAAAHARVVQAEQSRTR